MKIVEIKFVEIVTEGEFVEIKIRRNKMIYSILNHYLDFNQQENVEDTKM